MDKEHKSLPLEKIDMQVVSMEACDIGEMKKSFAGLAERESLELDPDLMYVRFIMCHEGDNANGDYFTKEVLHEAQFTPRFKPIDWEHGQPMIGTMLDSRYAEDSSGRAYIEAIGVIWKFIYPELAEQVKLKSATGELRLSMECYFKDCNYKYGEQIFDQEQADELGISDYHGREYMGQKVYRVFKSVVFGGVGVVANPADKEAVFLAVAKKQAQEVIQNNEVMSALSDEQIKAIAEIIRNTNDFRDKQISKDTVDAVTVAKFVKAFDKAKSNIVSRFNKETIATKEQLVSEVRDIINGLLTDVSNINNDYFVGLAKEDSTLQEEDNLAVAGLNLKLCDQCENIEVAEENKGGSETMEDNKNPEVVAEEVEVVVTEQPTPEATTTEEVVTEEVVVAEEIDTVDYQAKATQLEVQVTELEGKLQEKDTSLASLQEEFNALKEKVEAKEKEETLNTRLAELSEMGVELSEARKQKEVEKISGMDNEAFADYKEFLAELVGKKVEVVEASTDFVTEEEVVEEVEVQVQNEDQATASLNVETEQLKTITPFGHLAE